MGIGKQRGGYEISSDRDRLDLDVIHGFLRISYWSPGVERDVVERQTANSLPFGLYAPDGSQVGFARAITDYASHAYLCDVFVLAPHRGRGLGVWLMEVVLHELESMDLRRISLATADAHELYTRFGFEPANPDMLMTKGPSLEEIQLRLR